MPASLPPPANAGAMLPQNPTYKLGSSFTGAGLGLGIAGGVFIVLGVVLPCNDASNPNCDVASDKKLGDTFVDIGIGGHVVGAVCLAVGIPLLVVGANQVRREMGPVSVGPSGLRLAF